jgi:hypothetical protein
MSSLDCKRQTTNIYNLSKPHTIAETTVTSSVSRYKQQFFNRTHNHYSTDSTLTTVNTGMYWYKLIIYWTWLYIWVTLWVAYEKPELLTPSLAHEFTPVFWWGPCCSSFKFLCCPIVCLYFTMSYLRYLCVFAYSGVYHILVFFSSCVPYVDSLSPLELT